MAQSLSLSSKVGSAVALDLLRKDAVVAVPSRSRKSLDQLGNYLRDHGADVTNLVMFQDDVGTKEGALRVLEALQAHEATGGRLDHVVASLGSWSQAGPLLERSLSEFNEQLHNSAGIHFVALSVFLPRIADQEGSSYTILTGLVSVGDAALWGVSAVVRAEFHERQARVNELRIGAMIRSKVTEPAEVLDKDVATVITGIMAGHNAVKGQVIRLTADNVREQLETHAMQRFSL